MTLPNHPRISREDDDVAVVETTWGKLIWRVAGSLGNAEELTVGHCLIDPGCANGRHLHPNCEEVLCLLEGHIIHSWNDQEVEMTEGDMIAIPSGVVHNARNVGDGVAVMLICFSTAERRAVAVESEASLA